MFIEFYKGSNLIPFVIFYINFIYDFSLKYTCLCVCVSIYVSRVFIFRSLTGTLYWKLLYPYITQNVLHLRHLYLGRRLCFYEKNDYQSVQIVNGFLRGDSLYQNPKNSNFVLYF